MAFDGEDLVGFEILADVGEAGGDVEVHLFGEEAGRDVEFAELLHVSGVDADLFFELADGADHRVFAFVERAGGDLEEVFARGVAVLPYESRSSVLEDGDDHRAAFVHHDLAAVFDVAVANVIDADVEDAAVVDGAGSERRGFGHE